MSDIVFPASSTFEGLDYPSVADERQIWKPGTGQDSARFLIPPSQLYHKRPSLTAGKQVYVWPIGTEGFRRTGNALLGIHRYIGDNSVDVQVIHRDEARIEMTGTLPGITAQAHMIALIQVLTGVTPEPGKILYMPGIFEQIQYVTVENYDFSHAAEDRTHSIEYSISFLRSEVGKRAPDPHGKPPAAQPGVKVTGRGKPARYITTKDGVRSLRAIAKKAYGNANYWGRVFGHNKNSIQKFQTKRHIKIPMHKMPTYRWPIGMKFRV